MGELINNVIEYIGKAFSGLKPLIGSILAFISFILFPEETYVYAVGAVAGAAFLDIITKSYSIIKKNGGYRKATECGELFSRTLWERTEVKIVTYTTIMILSGLSYRVIFFKQAGIFVASLAYMVMFLREFQSNLENLMEAGADIGWLNKFLKKKEEEILNGDILLKDVPEELLEEVTDDKTSDEVVTDEYQEYLDSMEEKDNEN